MKHILIIFISYLLFTSPLVVQSSKYESVSQCVIQIMEERKLTGNEMFGVVKKGCERILGKVGIYRKKKQKKVLFYSDVNGNYEWVEGGDDTKEFKYEGEVEKGKPNGEGNLTYRGIFLYGGEWKDGERWNGTLYDKEENIIGKFMNGWFDQ